MTATFHPQGDEPGMGHTMPALYNLVYCSRASPGTDDAAVARIIQAARRSNPVYGITGILVFGGGIFFQWLEGPRDNISSLMDLIRSDPRHQSVVLLSEVEEVRERLFPGWDMEFVATDHIREVLQDALDSATDTQNAQALHQLLVELDAGQLRDLNAA